MAVAVTMVGADNNQQKAEAGVAQMAVMVEAGAEAAGAVMAAAAAAALAMAAAAAAAVAVVEVVAVAAAEMAAMAATAMAIAGGGQDKREVGMWFHVYKIYTRCTWAGGTGSE